MRKNPLLLPVVASAIVFLMTACGSSAPAREVRAETGYSAPDFALQDLAGKRVQLSDYAGKVVLLNFWATWCGPCRVELPIVQSLHERLGGDLVVLAISQGESREDVAAFVKDGRLTFRVLLDPQLAVGRVYKVATIPTTYVVDRQGVIQYKRRGTLIPGEIDLVLKPLLDAGK